MHATRRSFLLRGAALSAALALPVTRVIAQPRFAQNPFSLGVASGYPQPDSVVLWTRLAPDPLNCGGMPEANVPVRREIAADPKQLESIDAKSGSGAFEAFFEVQTLGNLNVGSTLIVARPVRGGAIWRP